MATDKKLLQLTVARVDGPIFDGEVVSITVPGADGEMTLMANHKPLISPLKAGRVILRLENGQEEIYELATGTLEVSHNHATVLI